MLALGIPTGLLAADAPDMEPVERWLAKREKVKTFASDFVQERRLRAVKAPLVSRGRLWFKAPESFRWELGEPARTVVVSRPGEGMWVLRPAKGKARHYQGDDLAAGGLLAAGFASNYENFVRRFKVSEVRREGGDYLIVAKPKARRAALALRKVEFTVDAASLRLRRLHLRFRDSSIITTTFSEAPREGIEIDDRIFELDLAGYDVDDD